MSDKMTIDRSSLPMGSYAILFNLTDDLPRLAVIQTLWEAHDIGLWDYRIGFVFQHKTKATVEYLKGILGDEIVDRAIEASSKEDGREESGWWRWPLKDDIGNGFMYRSVAQHLIDTGRMIPVDFEEVIRKGRVRT